MKKKIVVANWKMNPVSLPEAKILAKEVKKMAKNIASVEVVVCPPAIFLPGLVSPKVSKDDNLFWGMQSAHFATMGAFTGSISGAMGKSAGAKFVILGHSEQRAVGETDDSIRRKVESCISAGLKVILCVGEEKRDDHGRYLDVLRNQIKADLGDLKKSYYKEILIAYEPVWAVGDKAKATDTPEGFLHSAVFIRKVVSGLAGQEVGLAIPILYGGSVNRDNAYGFLKEGRADGLLVGRDSLIPEHFRDILKLTAEVK